MSTPVQLPLGIRLDDTATLDNFVADENPQLITILRANQEPFVYLWGAHGSGKTHLLQALCLSQVHANRRIMYLPLGGEDQFAPEILTGMEDVAMICIDDIHVIAGNPLWEEALFHFYNRLRETGGQLRVSATVSPTVLPIQLADLASRLQWGMTFQLPVLNDAQKCRALQQRAHEKGFDLPAEVAEYLLKRIPRDMHSLFAVLNELDIASLQAQRRLTIPFVKQWLE